MTPMRDILFGTCFRHLDLHLHSVDDLVALVKCEGLGCLLYKRDLKKAYRQIPVDPGDIHMLGYRVKDIFFVTWCCPWDYRVHAKPVKE